MTMPRLVGESGSVTSRATQSKVIYSSRTSGSSAQMMRARPRRQDLSTRGGGTAVEQALGERQVQPHPRPGQACHQPQPQRQHYRVARETRRQYGQTAAAHP